MRHFHEKQIFPWNTNIFMKHLHETQIFPWKHKYFHETFPWNKNLSVKYNIICFEAKIPNREIPRLYFIMWIPKNLITHSCEEGIDPQLCQHSFASRYNPDFSAFLANCSCQLPLPSRQLFAWLVLFQSFVNDKDEIFFTIAMKIQISLFAR